MKSMQTKRSVVMKQLESIKEEADLNEIIYANEVQSNANDEYETEVSGLNSRLELFTSDIHLYTNMLIQLEKEELDVEVPEIIKKDLYPFREKK